MYLETLCTSSMCAFLFVLIICMSPWLIPVYEFVDGVVKTVDPQLYNWELRPTQSLKRHHRGPCDLGYLRPPSQLLGAKTKERETETPFFPFGVKRKCGNKRQRGREEKHVLNSEKNKKKRKTQSDRFVSWPHTEKALKVLYGTPKSREYKCFTYRCYFCLAVALKSILC